MHRAPGRPRFGTWAALLLLAYASSLASSALGQESSSRWESAIAAFERADREQPPRPGGILFLGSSSIRFWDLERWLPEHGAVNRGFGGSQVAESLEHFDRVVLPHRPRFLVFYAGDNDIAAGKSPTQVVADVDALRQKLREKLPETRLVFIGIKPSLARWQLVEPMREVNAAVRRRAEEDPRLTYVDVDAPMIGPDGRPRPELFVADGLHLSDAGYRLWSSLVAPLLPFRHDDAVFPLEREELSSLHNHGSSVIETPTGDLLVAWFHGSGERQADDVAILGARWSRDTREWSEPFVLADTPGFPDTNCTLTVDRDGRLWLFHPTILDNRWESALLKYKVAADWAGPGVPLWRREGVLHMKPGEDFAEVVERKTREYAASLGLDPADPASWPEPSRRWFEANLERAADKLSRRLGWFTRAHPKVLDDGRILVGLYSDGFSFAAATWSDDGGETWSFSEPIVGGGAVQPSFGERDDGTLVAFLRDNGPPPKRVLVAESADRGESWTIARDHPDLVESGAGVELLELSSGRWLLFHNDLERGRHRLAVSLSEDQGRTFRTVAYLEEAAPDAGRFHYPSAIQSRDGTLHVTYSAFVRDVDPSTGEPRERKTIRHAWLNEAWLLERAAASVVAGGEGN